MCCRLHTKSKCYHHSNIHHHQSPVIRVALLTSVRRGTSCVRDQLPSKLLQPTFNSTCFPTGATMQEHRIASTSKINYTLERVSNVAG